MASLGLPFAMNGYNVPGFSHHLGIVNALISFKVLVRSDVGLDTLFHVIESITPYIRPKVVSRDLSKRRQPLQALPF